METIVTEIIEILKSNSDIIEREKQLHAYVGQVACQLITTAFRHIDDALWEEHRQEGAHSKRRDARTLVTLYGEVTISRRLVQTADGRNLYPLDQFLGVAPRSRLSPLLQYVVANVASKTVYRTTAYAVNMLSNATISHAQVGTVLRQVGAIYRKKEQADAKKLVGPEAELKRPEVLRIEGDAVAVKGVDGKTMELHRFQVAEGVEKHGKRSSLLGVHCVASQDYKAAEEMMREYLIHTYDLSSTLVLSNSDGGPGYGKEVFDRILGVVGRHEHFRDRYHVNKKCKERLNFAPRKLVDDVQRAIWRQDEERLKTLLSTAESLATDTSQEEQVALLRAYLERNWSSLRLLSKRGIDLEHAGLGACESNHRVYSYRMKHQGKHWSKVGADAIAGVITGIRNGDLSDAWEKETIPVGVENENLYRNAVRNALKKSKKIEHVAAKNGRILMDCPASSAMGSLFRQICNGGMLA